MKKECRNGHPKTPENLRPRKDGYFDCIPCGRRNSKRYKDGIRELVRERGRDYYNKNREAIGQKSLERRQTDEWRDRHYKRTYGISLKDRQKLAEEQQNCCAICQREEQLVTDHDHKTGGLRGLLCAHCNTGLGYFRDSPELLQVAALYLVNKG